MAEFSKYTANNVGRLFLHNNRTKGDGVQHSNESIDDSRTFYNYHLKKGDVSDVQKRLNEVFSQGRSTAVVLGEMIVTLPQKVKKEDERDFFQLVYDFYAQDIGEENIINAVVHKDEKTPHLHLDFVPVVEMDAIPQNIAGQRRYADWVKKHNGEKPEKKLCCREFSTRNYLKGMHKRLDDYITENLGYETGIINGATAGGNRTVLSLKAESLKKDIEKMEHQKKHLASEIQSMLTLAKNYGIEKNDVGLFPMMQKIADLEQQNAVLRQVITRHGYTWQREELEAMQAKKYVPAKSVPVNVYNGSLVDADIEKNAVIVIELPDKVPRPLPQQKLIESDGDLERQAKFVQSYDKQVLCRQSRTSERIYLFVKTDTPKQTIENILLMEKQLRELDLKGRKLYMDRFDSDTYDVARSMLMKCEIESLYFTGFENAQKEKGTERQTVKEI